MTVAPSGASQSIRQENVVLTMLYGGAAIVAPFFGVRSVNVGGDAEADDGRTRTAAKATAARAARVIALTIARGLLRVHASIKRISALES
jgi:hypothetical protein